MFVDVTTTQRRIYIEHWCYPQKKEVYLIPLSNQWPLFLPQRQLLSDFYHYSLELLILGLYINGILECVCVFCVCPGLASFTQCNVLGIHSCYSFFYWVVFHWINIVQLVYSVSFDWYLCCFLLFAIMNEYALKSCSSICKYIYFLIDTKEWNCWVVGQMSS